MGLYAEAEQIVVEEAPRIPLFHGTSQVAVKSYVEGFKPTPFATPYLSSVRLKS